MNTKLVSAVLRFALVLFFMCLFMVFIVDKGSAEFVIMLISCVINAIIAVVAAVVLKSKRKKE